MSLYSALETIALRLKYSTNSGDSVTPRYAFATQRLPCFSRYGLRLSEKNCQNFPVPGANMALTSAIVASTGESGLKGYLPRMGFISMHSRALFSLSATMAGFCGGGAGAGAAAMTFAARGRTAAASRSTPSAPLMGSISNFSTGLAMDGSVSRLNTCASRFTAVRAPVTCVPAAIAARLISSIDALSPLFGMLPTCANAPCNASSPSMYG